MVIGIHKTTEPFEFDESGWFGYEKPAVLEAFRVLAKEGYYVTISGHDYDMRKKRLQKEYEENTKSPGPGEEQPKEKVRIICCSAYPKADFYYKHVLNEGNPALAEAASQFNDALLDEQAKKIEKLAKKNVRLGKEISRLNKIIHKKNMKIEEMRKESSRHLRGKIKMFYVNVDLEGKLKDKDAVLSDVAEELRLSKIREKNLTELCQKYIKANEELKEKLADKVVDKIDTQASKSAESALAWKEKVIAKKDMALAYYEKKIAEKDEALDEANKHQQQAYRSCADKNKEIEALKLQISAWEKRGNGIDWKRNADAIKLYVNRASHERLWNPISQDICNEKELSFIINHGGKRVKYALRFDGTDIVYECSDPDKKPSLFRDDSVGAVTNLKDCSLAKDTVDIAEEGGDNSGVILLCGKDFIDAIKKMK